MSFQIHVIDCCSTCSKELPAPAQIFKEINARIKYCTKECFDKRTPSYEETIVLAQERRLSNDIESFTCTEDFAQIMVEFYKQRDAQKRVTFTESTKKKH